MLGFYARNLKCETSRFYADIINNAFSNPSCDEDGFTRIQFQGFGKKGLKALTNATYAVLRDNPQIFYYETQFMVRQKSINTIELEIPLIYSVYDIQRLKPYLNSEINKIIHRHIHGTTKWEKEKEIFEYLNTHIDYLNNNSHEQYNIIGAIRGKAVCEGISKLFAVLCHVVGINCIVVFDNNHMWNMVSIDGVSANVDATAYTAANSLCDYSLFNCTDDELSEHTTRAVKFLPKCSDNSISYYSKNNAVFNEEKSIIKYTVDRLYKKEAVIHIKYGNADIKSAFTKIGLLYPFGLSVEINPSHNTAIIYKTLRR